MYLKNKTLYAGITNENGAMLVDNDIVNNTGYFLQRITDGAVLGVKYEMLDNEKESMFIEIEDGLASNHYEKDRTIIAGVYSEIGFDLCINKEDLFTGKKFLRIHDGLDFGNKIYLGDDYSYYGTSPRYDVSKYYVEVEDLIEEENEVIDE